jgi:uncharacterized membrane protein HdeD (DUF308 family)
MPKSTENRSVFRHLWKSVFGLGLVTLALGVVVLVWPGKSVVVAGALFGVNLLASGIAQAIAAFTVHVPGGSRVLLFLSGALSVALGVFAFHDFNQGAAVWVLATWIGVGFLFQGVAQTALAINHKELPEHGWHIFMGLLTVLAGMMVIAWPITSIVVLAIVAGAWLVVIGITQIVWAVKARKAGAKVEHVADRLKSPTVVG